MDEGEREGWNDVLGRITKGLDTCLWPLLSSKDTIFLEGALLLFPTKRRLPSLPPTTSPSVLAAPTVVCRPLIYVLQAFLLGQSGHQVPIRGETVLCPSRLSLQSLDFLCPGMDCMEKASLTTFQIPAWPIRPQERVEKEARNSQTRSNLL